MFSSLSALNSSNARDTTPLLAPFLSSLHHGSFLQPPESYRQSFYSPINSDGNDSDDDDVSFNFRSVTLWYRKCSNFYQLCLYLCFNCSYRAATADKILKKVRGRLLQQTGEISFLKFYCQSFASCWIVRICARLLRRDLQWFRSAVLLSNWTSFKSLTAQNDNRKKFVSSFMCAAKIFQVENEFGYRNKSKLESGCVWRLH